MWCSLMHHVVACQAVELYDNDKFSARYIKVHIHSIKLDTPAHLCLVWRTIRETLAQPPDTAVPDSG